MNNLRKELKLRKANVRHYFPDVLANAKEFTVFADTVEPELDAIINKIFSTGINTFACDVDEAGLERYEKMLGIHNISEKSFEARRRMVLSKINNMAVYTHSGYQQMLDLQYGAGEVVIRPEYDDYVLWLNLSADMVWRTREIRTQARCIIPANLDIKVENVKTVTGRIYAAGVCKISNTIHISPDLGFIAPSISGNTNASGYIGHAHKVIYIRGGLNNG